MTEKIQTKTKTSKSKFIIILLIIAIISAAVFSYYAYSKYTSTLTGNAAATVAKWSFKVNGETVQFATINLEDTMDNANNIIEKRIAPGTSGTILLELDGRGSEVAIDYSIALNTAEKPTNLKMYTDSSYTELVEPDANGIINITGIILLEDVETVQNKYIYWKWPYETGTTDDEIQENDEIDTQQSSFGTIEMPITVTAVQRDPSKPEGLTLAEVVSVGDYVNYNAASGNGVGKSYTTEETLTGSSTTSTFSSSETFNSEVPAQWRVLSVDKETGKVELISAGPTSNTVTLGSREDLEASKTAYKNAETVLNNIGALYGYGDGAASGRSITVEDIAQYSNYDKKLFQQYKKYGDTVEYQSGTFIMEDGTEVTATTENPISMTQTAYMFGLETFTNNVIYNMLNSLGGAYENSGFWLASRGIALYPSNCAHIVMGVNRNGVQWPFYLQSSPTAMNLHVCPVVSLKNNIQTTGKDENGAWNLVI